MESKMKHLSPQTPLNGMTQHLRQLADQLAIVNDMAGNLKILCDYYYVDDPIYGGPATPKQLLEVADYLDSAYMNMAALLGTDPCEKFDETKARLKAFRVSRSKR